MSRWPGATGGDLSHPATIPAFIPGPPQPSSGPELGGHTGLVKRREEEEEEEEEDLEMFH